MSYALLLITSALVIITRFLQQYQRLESLPNRARTTLAIRLFDEGYQSGSSYVYSSLPYTLVFPGRIQAKIGDKVKIDATVSRSKDTLTDLMSNKIRLNIGSYSVIDEGHSSGILFLRFTLAKVVKTRENIANILAFSLPEPHRTLAEGMVIGSQSTLDRVLQLDLKRTGLMHVIAASGYNVSIMIQFLQERVLRRVTKGWALAILYLVLLSFAAIVGFSASILRAIFMAGLAILSRKIGRAYHPFWALCMFSLIWLAIQPFALFSISFELTISATAGMILFSSPLQRYFRILCAKKFPEAIDAASATIAATLGTLPIMVWRFGTLSLVSVLANTALIWMVPLIMAGTGLLLLSTVIFTPISKVIGYLLWWIIELFLEGTHSFGQFPLAMVEVGNKGLVIGAWFLGIWLLFSTFRQAEQKRQHIREKLHL